jgi:hypothetical protein
MKRMRRRMRRRRRRRRRGDSYSIRQQRSFPCAYWDGCM